ncbi:condensation domain-containing protein [Micromonospora sp. R77]|uniref:condensation domain-containing protein n=1 Tax=Micromonospora sp. R77 TaxID=2925836 RepID=UPI001F606A24|nr:condensation domain-containing protein [Micromonospora sp. R77]MCI4066800.1 condensation domain-containing protein [Micromonospora sp. R77]
MPAELNGAVRSALTFGQLSVLRALEQLPRDSWWETYLVWSTELPAEVTLSAVTDAARHVQRRHESLRTLFVDDGDGLVALTLPEGDPPVEAIELPGATADEAAAAAQHACRPGFVWDRQFGWRTYLVTDAGRATHLAVVVDHIVADGYGLQRVVEEIRALLGCGDETGAQWLADEPSQPRELAQAQHSDAWRPRRTGAHRYWDRLLTELPPTVFPWPPAPQDTGRIEATLVSPRARAALGLAAHRLKVSTQSVVLALTGIAVAATQGQDDVVLTLQASNRFDRRWRHIVSSMNQAAPLAISTATTADTFDDFAPQVQWASLNAYRHGSYHFDEMVQKVRQARGVDLEFDFYFNFMAHEVMPTDEPLRADFPDPVVRVDRALRQAGQRIDLKIQPGDEMPFTLRVDPTLIPAHRLEHLMYWFDDELMRLAGGGAFRVKDSRERAAG